MKLVAFVAAFFAHEAASKASETSTWAPCDMYTTDNSDNEVVECCKFSAPLCYPGVCSVPKGVKKTIELFVKRFPAADPETATNVWILGDDIGVASDYMEMTMAMVDYKVNNTVNIYTIDHRGTGRSTRLGCTGKTSDPTVGYFMDPALVASCAEELEQKYGDLAAFSPTSAAHDIVSLIAKLSNGASTILYGVQYGALLVERVMHLAPPEVTGYVLDAPLSTTGAYYYLSEQDRDIGEVAEAFMERCDQDRVCGSHFQKPNTLIATYHDILADMDNQVDSACVEMMDTTDVFHRNASASWNLRAALSYLLYTPMTVMTIPQLVYRLNRCRSNDVIALKTFFSKLMNIEVLDFGPLYSNVLHYLVAFSELWERPTPSLTEMKKHFIASAASWGEYVNLPLYCAFSKEQSKACAKYEFGQYEAHGIIYKHDQYWNMSASIPSQASVLVLSTTEDIAAPHKYTKRLVESLDGDNKELITFDRGGHGTLLSTYSKLRIGDWDTCALKVFVSYLSSEGDLSGLDKSCLNEMEAFEMIPSDFSEANFDIATL